MKLNKDDIRRKHYPTGGLFIVIFLGVVGLVLVLMSGILEVRNYDMLYECVAKNGMAIIVGLFFVFITSYCLVSYFRNVVLEPKKEILFLLRKENRKSIFVTNFVPCCFEYNCQK